MVILLAITEKKIFPSIFRRAMLPSWLKVLEFSSFRIAPATAFCHSDGMIFLVQTTLMRDYRSLSILGHFLYDLYGILLML